ncbi:hypothetical protein PHLCEN_2v8503 [Hermanssonia centrifuga]|uniref:Uncharacterized protein n=1 Tax=Hermanssonia centrifuga TaxID=98765 RepID=A0A2R6NTG9_9APHY|nr:hypothetical protein PHLCEN_2v8503 [Hermanssonia centrifuga]
MGLLWHPLALTGSAGRGALLQAVDLEMYHKILSTVLSGALDLEYEIPTFSSPSRSGLELYTSNRYNAHRHEWDRGLPQVMSTFSLLSDFQWEEGDQKV